MLTLIGKKAILRQDFLKKFVQVGGYKYDEAAKIYDAMVSLFADAILSGQKITVGRVLSIRPVKRKARKVNMHFHGRKKTIHISDRIVFKVNLYREFLNKHELGWIL